MATKSTEMIESFTPKKSSNEVRMDIPIQKLFDECLEFISMVKMEE